MKLTDLKEWGGRDLPGPGDEATWDGRSPESEHEPMAQTTPAAELAQEYLFVDPHAIATMHDEKEIVQYMKTCGFTKVTNDTGHAFVPAIKHAIKPMIANMHDEVAVESLPSLAQLGESLPEQITITELQAAAKKWAHIAFN